MQVSRSKKWLSKPAVDKDGKPILQVNGKPVLRKSYSVLQDDFFQHMRAAGYTDVDVYKRQIYQRSELDWLIYNDPAAYADLVLNGDPETYLKTVTEYKPLD